MALCQEMQMQPPPLEIRRVAYCFFTASDCLTRHIVFSGVSSGLVAHFLIAGSFWTLTTTWSLIISSCNTPSLQGFTRLWSSVMNSWMPSASRWILSWQFAFFIGNETTSYKVSFECWKVFYIYFATLTEVKFNYRKMLSAVSTVK